MAKRLVKCRINKLGLAESGYFICSALTTVPSSSWRLPSDRSLDISLLGTFNYFTRSIITFPSSLFGMQM